MTKMKMLASRATLVAAAFVMMLVAGTTWLGSGPALAGPQVTAAAAATDAEVERPAPKRGGKTVSGKLNINTASEDQLILLPGVGPAKAERVVSWRTKHGAFKRVADLRHVKGFGYKTIKKLEPF